MNALRSRFFWMGLGLWGAHSAWAQMGPPIDPVASSSVRPTTGEALAVSPGSSVTTRPSQTVVQRSIEGSGNRALGGIRASVALQTYLERLQSLERQRQKINNVLENTDEVGVNEHFRLTKAQYVTAPFSDALRKAQEELRNFRRRCTGNDQLAKDVRRGLDQIESELLAFQSAMLSGNSGKPHVDAIRDLERELADKMCGEEHFNSLLSWTYPSSIPDITEAGLDAWSLGMMLNNRRFRSDVAGSRGSPLSEQSASAEMDFVASAAAACNEVKLDKQKKANPLSKTVVTSIVKAMKCSVIPALATNFLDTEFQKMSLGLAAADVQGEGWDVNCDPKEIALWDSMRPLDPAEIDKRWGISAMANPSYINNLRMLPPLRSPFPVVALPSGGFVTPFGNIGVTTQPGQRREGVNVVANIAGTDPRSTTLVRTGRAASRGGRSYRGLAQGASLVKGTRRLAGNISNNRNTVQSAATLRSGASNTRRLAETMVNNNRTLGAAGSRRANAASATTVRVTTRALAGTRASRTTAESMVNRVSGRGSRVDSTNPRGPGVDVVDNRRRANEQERRRIEQLVRLYQGNIEEAVTKSQSVQIKIQEKIAERDSKVNGLMEQIINKPPRTQAKKIQETRLELMNLDKELAAMKAEYDVFASSIADQSALIQTLVMFGPEAPNFPGFGGRANPRGFPTVTTSGSRGSPSPTGFLWNKSELFSRWLMAEMIPSAWAATTRNLFGSEEAWAAAWEKFQKDLEGYAALRAREDLDQTQKLSREWKKRSDSITESSARDFDSDTMTTMEMYADALANEVGDIVDRHNRKEIQVEASTFSVLNQTRADAVAALDALDTVALQYRDSMPTSVDDNPEVWWALAQELMIH